MPKNAEPSTVTAASNLKLDDGSQVAVLGGGPAGSFFSYFLLQFAEQFGTKLQLDIYESRDFKIPGPGGCNMCGGIVSESLVQNLAAEGIVLPDDVVQRGIDSYVLHTDVADVRIETPLHEKRIAAVYRGAGPRGSKQSRWRSFDGYLQELAVKRGANVVHGRVEEVTWEGDKPHLKLHGGESKGYDLLAVGVGVNSATLKLFEKLDLGYSAPQTTKTYICEFFVGKEAVDQCLGSSMHVFLLDIPRLEFAAIVPKGDYATLCMMGEDIDKPLIESFMNAPEVKQLLPATWQAGPDFCHCSPRINTADAAHPFADRLVFIGDCGTTKLYKDGIGAAYRTAKAAAKTAMLEGVSGQDFKRHFWPTCQNISHDNLIGRLIFAITRQIQRRRFARRGVVRMAAREQAAQGKSRRMSSVLWDTFTGSAPYQDVFLRASHPAFFASLVWNTLAGNLHKGRPST
jgi:flavin-dependent dehydrogenase